MKGSALFVFGGNRLRNYNSHWVSCFPYFDGLGLMNDHFLGFWDETLVAWHTLCRAGFFFFCSGYIWVGWRRWSRTFLWSETSSWDGIFRLFNGLGVHLQDDVRCLGLSRLDGSSRVSSRMTNDLVACSLQSAICKLLINSRCLLSCFRFLFI